MLLRQLFNHATFSYTYLLADPMSSEAVFIDPVKGKLRDYVQLTNELGLTITAAIDTHHHDDWITGITALRDLWGCDAISGAPNENPGVNRQVEDGDTIKVGGMQLSVIHTPGHTEDSYCYLIEQPGKSAVFTGDTLLVRTVGLSNQGTSNPRMHYDSLYNVLAELPDDTIIYPGRDFKGWPLSTIGEEKSFNPYMLTKGIEFFLALKDRQEPADIQPLVKVEEEEVDEAIEETVKEALKSGEVGPDFYLPDDESKTEAKPVEKTEEKTDAELPAELDDASKVRSWH
ncbi:MAG: MBL fold metallo-hydrolase [Halieaceae bacterium]